MYVQESLAFLSAKIRNIFDLGKIILNNFVCVGIFV